MRRLAVVALVVTGFGLPVCAQHSASHGSFSSHAGASPRSGFSAPHTNRFLAAPGFSPGGGAGVSPGFRGAAPGRWTGRAGYPDHARRPYVRFYGAGIPYVAAPSWEWVAPGYLAYPDDSGYGDAQPAPDNSSPAGPDNYPPAGPEGYAPGPGGYAQGYASGPDDNAPGPGYGPTYTVPSASPEQPPAPSQPAARRPYQPSMEPAQSAATPETVTLIFKDGRPPEQVQNYILTRSTLYVQDQGRRSVPLDQLDLAATAKANREAGVDFEIPDPTR